MSPEIMNNASDAYRHLSFCRQAASWDQSDLFSSLGQEEVCAIMEETICLTQLSRATWTIST